MLHKRIQSLNGSILSIDLPSVEMKSIKIQSDNISSLSFQEVEIYTEGVLE